MAYNKTQLKQAAIKAIKQHDLCFIEDVVHNLPCSLRTFYNYKLQDMQSIKELLYANKLDKKQEAEQAVRKAWSTHWQAAAWFLERWFPDQYALKNRIEASVKHDGKIEIVWKDEG